MTPHQAEGADSFRRWCSEEKVNEMWYISSGGSLLSFKHSQHYLQEDVEWGVAQQLRVLFCIFNFVIHVLAYLKWKAFFLFEAFLHGAAYIVCILKVLEDGKVHDTRDRSWRARTFLVVLPGLQGLAHGGHCLGRPRHPWGSPASNQSLVQGWVYKGLWE